MYRLRRRLWRPRLTSHHHARDTQAFDASLSLLPGTFGNRLKTGEGRGLPHLQAPAHGFSIAGERPLSRR